MSQNRMEGDRLGALFQRSDKADVFTDSEIEEVSRILQDLRLPGSDCPRTYIVLRTIGHLDLLDTFIKLGFDDQWFPVGARSLPSSLSPAVRTAFANAQTIILTKSLDVEHGSHRHFTPGEPLPFEIRNRLGSGGYSQVDRIQSRISNRSYALKRIRRRNVFGNDTKEAMKRFKSEVDIMRGLQHRHIIQFIGSYTDKAFLGIITSPVADMDLAAFLKLLCISIESGLGSDKTIATEMSSSIRSFFGCLAAALAYLHDNRVRHKDIKPQNILIYQGTVLFTDFGLSRHFADGQGSTTSGLTAATPRYSPPEVAAYEQRNTSADVWSLGCVYLEMLAALQGHDMDWLKDYMLENGTKEPYYRGNAPACGLLFDKFEAGLARSDRTAISWVRKMIVFDRSTRWTAAHIVQQIRSCDDMETGNIFCGICCRGDEESDSHDSLDDQPEQVTSLVSRLDTLAIGADRITTSSSSKIRSHDSDSTALQESYKGRKSYFGKEQGSAAGKSWQGRDAPLPSTHDAPNATSERIADDHNTMKKRSKKTRNEQITPTTPLGAISRTYGDSPAPKKATSPVLKSSQTRVEGSTDDNAKARNVTVHQGTTAIAEYDYDMQEDNEINLKEGDIITNIDMVDEDWWIGQNRAGGGYGLFPSNFVKLQTLESDLVEPVASKNSATIAEEAKSKMKALVENLGIKTDPKLPVAVAMYDYDAAEDNELSFTEGARIVNVVSNDQI
jgi:serine/threonine protein kinase